MRQLKIVIKMPLKASSPMAAIQWTLKYIWATSLTTWNSIRQQWGQRHCSKCTLHPVTWLPRHRKNWWGSIPLKFFNGNHLECGNNINYRNSNRFILYSFFTFSFSFLFECITKSFNEIEHSTFNQCRNICSDWRDICPMKFIQPCLDYVTDVLSANLVKKKNSKLYYGSHSTKLPMNVCSFLCVCVWSMVFEGELSSFLFLNCVASLSIFVPIYINYIFWIIGNAANNNVTPFII